MPDKEKNIDEEVEEFQEPNQYCTKSILIGWNKEIIPRPKQNKTEESKE